MPKNEIGLGYRTCNGTRRSFLMKNTQLKKSHDTVRLNAPVDLVLLLAQELLDNKVAPGLQLLLPVAHQRAGHILIFNHRRISVPAMQIQRWYAPKLYTGKIRGSYIYFLFSLGKNAYYPRILSVYLQSSGIPYLQ